MSIAVDFGITQVVDGNWGVHAVIKKSLFAGAQDLRVCPKSLAGIAELSEHEAN